MRRTQRAQAAAAEEPQPNKTTIPKQLQPGALAIKRAVAGYFLYFRETSRFNKYSKALF